VRRQVGTEYDPINKRTVPVYVYEQGETWLGEFEVETQDGRAAIDLSAFSLEEQHHFRVELRTTDTAGRVILETVYAYPEDWYGLPGGDGYFWLDHREGPGGAERRLAEGGRAELVLRNAQAVPVSGGRVALISVSGGIRTAEVMPAGALFFRFEREQLPSTRLYAAYFDGGDVRRVEPMELAFDPAARTLTVDLQTGQTDYLPGEEAVIDLRVQDAEGRPVQAQLCVSVVDEAALAVAPLYGQSLIDQLYRRIDPGQVQTFVSSTALPDFRGGGGGGDGGSYRADFEDTPAFLTLETDKNGRAKARFKLGDSLTAWRVTALAAGETAGGDPAGGQQALQLTTGLPFFIDLIGSRRYGEADDVAFAIRGFGSALSRESAVSIECALQPNGAGAAEQRQSAAGLRGEYLNVNFGRLPAGRYTLSVLGKSGRLSDAVQVELEVSGQLIELPVTRFVELDALSALRPRRFPVELTLYDTALRSYLETQLGELAGVGAAVETGSVPTSVESTGGGATGEQPAVEAPEPPVPGLGGDTGEQPDAPRFGY